MHKTLKVISYTSLLAVGGFILSGCSLGLDETSARADGPASQRVLPVVEAVQARSGSLPLSERLNGTVIAQNQVGLYPEISGRVVRVLARNGDFVRAGETLVVLEDSQFREQIKQAEASLKVDEASLSQAQARFKELEAQYRRTAALAEEGLSSQVEVETLQAQLDSARAAIELAEAQILESKSVIDEMQTVLLKTEVRAPISGTIGRRNAEVGMQVGTNSELFTIGDLSRLRVEVVLTAGVLSKVRVGQSVKVHARAEGFGHRIFNARLSRISPFLDPVTRSTEAEIDIENQNGILKPGMSVTAEILYGESAQATLLPSSALFSHPNTGEVGIYRLPAFSPPPSQGETTLFELSPPVKTEFLPIEVVAEGRMEVGVNGLEPGSWVVTLGQNLLVEGRGEARVRPTEWDQVLELQSLQREDLLESVLHNR